jgi:CDP-diacylglycerol---serine O-phosphatidyltransferase
MADAPPAPVGARKKVAAWRYVVPNSITALSIVFGALGVQAALRGKPIAAAWWGLYCTLTDRLDGATAKALGAQSELGVQLDSLADMVSFGLVPPTVLYAYFSSRPLLGWTTPVMHALLAALAISFTLAAAFRLARYNVKMAHGGDKHYTGTPTTMTAGIILVLFLTCLKYSNPDLRYPEDLDHLYLLPHIRLDSFVPAAPWLLVAGAAGMLSPLRVPKLGRTRSKITTFLLLGSALLGYLFGLFHLLPEYLAGGGLFYLGVCIRYHLSARSR